MQIHEHGCYVLLLALGPLCDGPGSVRHQGKAPKLCCGAVGRSFPQAPTPPPSGSRGDKSAPGFRVSFLIGCLASAARQAVGAPPVVKWPP